MWAGEYQFAHCGELVLDTGIRCQMSYGSFSLVMASVPGWIRTENAEDVR